MFTAVRLALDPQKLLLVACAVFLTAAGDWILLKLSIAPPTATTPHWPWTITSPWQLPIMRPVMQLIEMIRPLIQVGESFSVIGWSLIRLVWFLMVWATIGGAVTRIAAFNVSRNQSIGIAAACKFSLRRFRDYMTPAFLATVGIGSMWLLCCVFGLFGRIPWVGEFGVAILWFVPLAMGAVMAILLVAFVVAWPLSVVTISTEGADGFEALSRPLNYILTRPAQYAFQWLLAILHGGLVVWGLFLFWGLIVHMTGWAVGPGIGHDRISEITCLVPGGHSVDLAFPSGSALVIASSDSATPSQQGSSKVAAFWYYVAASVIGSFSVSYFWCAATVNYFLIRRSEDAVEFEELYLPSTTDEPDLALAGVAASTTEAAERPVRAPADALESENPDTASDAPPIDSGDASRES